MAGRDKLHAIKPFGLEGDALEQMGEIGMHF